MLKGHSVFVIELCPISFPFPLLSNVSHVGQNDADIVQCSPLNSQHRTLIDRTLDRSFNLNYLWIFFMAGDLHLANFPFD